MGPELEKALNELSLRMRLIRAIQENQKPEDTLTERESLILQHLAERGTMTVSQISEAWPNFSESTISMTLTKLWKRKLVSKTISPENQRITHVSLTDKGRNELDLIFKQRRERFQALFDAIQLSDHEREVFIGICQRGVACIDQLLGKKSEALQLQLKHFYIFYITAIVYPLFSYRVHLSKTQN